MSDVLARLEKALTSRAKAQELMLHFKELEGFADQLSLQMFEEDYRMVFKSEIYDREWLKAELMPESQTPNIPKVFMEELQVKWIFFDKRCKKYHEQLTTMCEDSSELKKSIQQMESSVTDFRNKLKEERREKLDEILKPLVKVRN